ncbi:MAG: hypothetical protein JNJ59_18455 [Deltaproteobacteria bacterium]|nr:hypothetical protein [Deltaproteobacteria bacterium]
MRTHPIPTSSLTLVTAFAALALALVPACDTAVAGKNDLLKFRWDTSDNILPQAFSTPLGAGYRSRIEVLAKSNDASVAVIDAASSDPEIAEVVATAGNIITIEGRTAGAVEVSVRTALGEDLFDLTVVNATRIDLEHPGVLVSDNPPSKAVQGGTARFILKLRSADDKVAVGFGDVAATVAPTGAATVLPSEDIGFLPVRFAAVGELTLQGANDTPLTVEVIPDADVVAIELKGLENGANLQVGGTLLGIVRGVTEDGSKVVGIGSLAVVESSNPSVCTVTEAAKLGEGVYTVLGKAAGTCTVSATLGGRASRRDVTVK